MSCAYQLAKMGYRVTVLEAGGRPGGMLADSIPGFRLPERVVDREMARIIDFGVTMSLHTTVGKDVSLQQLKAEFDAVYLAIGAHGSPALGIEGETATNVLSGLSFLEQAKAGQAPPLDSQVIVVGGGNTGIDAARTARRLGAKVTMLYRRTSAEMPADAAEVDAAQEEGVDIRYLSAPLRVESSAADTLLTCQKMMLGELDASGRARPIPVPGSEFTLRGTVIAAVGQELCAVGFEQLELSSKWIRADRFGRTGDDKVFAGGDAVSGPGLVVEAIGAGAQAARAIDAFLRKTPLDLPDRTVISFATVPLDKLRHLNPPGCPARRESPRLAADLRLATPQAEESLAFSPNDASTESKRCFGCGHYQASYGTMPNTTHFGLSCVACHNCDAICPHGAIEMNGFYRVDEGRWTTPHDVPVVVQDGLPNPLRLPRPTPFAEIASKITEVERVIYTRRSTRVFNPEPLPRELIERVLEAGRFAPSAGNCEGVKYVVITDRAVMDDLDRSTRAYIAPFTKMYANKKPANQWLKRLLCLLYPHGGDPRPMAGAAAVLDPHFGDGPMNVFFDAPCAIMVVPHALHISDPEFDAGLICQNMVLAAHSLGLGSCYVGFPTSALKADKKTRRKFQGTLGLEWPFDRPPVQWVQAAPPGP
jgi:nitroreductase/thioredoxin reductase